MLEPDLVEKIKKSIAEMKTMNQADFPVGKSFECPICHYSRTCAKIYPDTLLFRCFACNERRRIIE